MNRLHLRHRVPVQVVLVVQVQVVGRVGANRRSAQKRRGVRRAAAACCERKVVVAVQVLLLLAANQHWRRVVLEAAAGGATCNVRSDQTCTLAAAAVVVVVVVVARPLRLACRRRETQVFPSLLVVPIEAVVFGAARVERADCLRVNCRRLACFPVSGEQLVG